MIGQPGEPPDQLGVGLLRMVVLGEAGVHEPEELAPRVDRHRCYAHEPEGYERPLDRRRGAVEIGDDRARIGGQHGDGRYVDLREDVSIEPRSEEHTSELQSLMRISYAVFC